MAINTNINIPYSPFIDQATGRPSQEWLIWLMNPKVIQLDLANPLGVTSGGTGLSQIPTDGQLLIGNGTGYTLDTLTPGSYISIINGSGEITVEWDNLLPPPVDYGPEIENLKNQFLSQPSNEVGELQQQINTLRQELQTTPHPELGTMSQLQQAWVPWITFDNAPEVLPPDVGTVAWDGGTTLGVQMTANVLGRVNESGYYYIKASAAITKGQVVMFTGAVGASGVPTGAPATGVTDGSYIMGIAAESLLLNDFGLVQFIGTLRGVDTSAYADGDILWYDPAVTGGLTKTKPVAPNVKVQMAAVISAANNGTILIRVSAGSELGGTDSNVQFGTLSNKDLIQYDSALKYWKNVAPSTVTIGTATNLAGGLANEIPYQSAPSTTTFSPNFLYDGTNMAVGGSLNASYRLNLVGAGVSWGNDTTVRGVATYDASNVYLGSYTNTPVVFNTNNTERMRIDTSGLVGIGASPVGTSKLQVFGPDSSATVRINRYSNDTSSPNFILSKTRGTTANSTTAVNSGDQTGSLVFQGADGTAYGNTAGIISIADGAPSAGSTPGALVLATTASGANTSTERVRITAAGNVGIGTVSPSAKLDIASGNLLFSSTAQRITGDMSNATVANRLSFQSSTANGNTVVQAVPNGTSVITAYRAFNAADPTNAAFMGILANSTESRLEAGITGTGTYLPMTFQTSGTEKLRIAADTTGTYTFGGTAPRITGDFSGANSARLYFQSSTVNGVTSLSAMPNGTGTQAGWFLYSESDLTNNSFAAIRAVSGVDMRLQSGISGTGTYLPMTFYTGGSEAMRIDTSRNVGIGTASPVAGYRLNVVNDSGNAQQLIRAGTNFNSTIAFGDQDSSTSGQLLYAHNGDYMRFDTAATERMRIDSSGLVGIGATPAGTAKLQVYGPDNSASVRVNRYSNDTTSPNLILSKTRGSTANDTTTVNSGDQAGSLVYQVANGSAYGITAGVISIADGAPGAGSTPGALILATTASGATTSTERLRIDSFGNVGIGTTPSVRFQVLTANPTSANEVARFQGGTDASNYRNYISLYTTNPGYWWELSNEDASGAGSTNGFAFRERSGAASVVRMYLAQGGNVGIGTASPGNKLDVVNTANSSTVVKVTNTSTGASAASFFQASSNDGNLYAIAQGTGGGGGGTLYWDGTNQLLIKTFGAYPLTFGTNNTERMRIDSSGNVGVGAASTSTTRFYVKGSDATSSNSAIVAENSAGTKLFYCRNDGLFNTGAAASSPYNNTTANAANVNVDANGNLLRSTSSLRYKTDVQNAAHGLPEVMQLRPVTYRGINDGERVFGGLIAEEVHDVGLTEFVVYDAEDRPDALHYGNMVGLLTKAIQQQQELIDKLTARVAQLETQRSNLQ